MNALFARRRSRRRSCLADKSRFCLARRGASVISPAPDPTQNAAFTSFRSITALSLRPRRRSLGGDFRRRPAPQPHHPAMGDLHPPKRSALPTRREASRSRTDGNVTVHFPTGEALWEKGCWVSRPHPLTPSPSEGRGGGKNVGAGLARSPSPVIAGKNVLSDEGVTGRAACCAPTLSSSPVPPLRSSEGGG